MLDVTAAKISILSGKLVVYGESGREALCEEAVTGNFCAAGARRGTLDPRLGVASFASGCGGTGRARIVPPLILMEATSRCLNVVSEL